MFSVLADRIFARLFAAQAVALVGTGLATVALALLAYDLAGADAGTVLGTALAIKMIAYVGVAPVASAFVSVLPRRTTLVALHMVRAGIVALLPFVTQIWQVYALIFALQAASAAFTPAFQATIPDILTDEDDYTNALSLSRLAFDLESLVSPMLAGLFLVFFAANALFAGTAIGFLVASVLILSVSLPSAAGAERRSVYDRTTRGVRIYLATPRLRALLAISMAVAAAGAIVIVNTVVYVQGLFGLGERQTAWALASFGAGSMLAALLLPRLLRTGADRSVMLAGALVLTLGAAAASQIGTYASLIAVWFVLGLGFSAAQVPAGRLLRRSAHPDDRPALFAAQFALSHACWLIAYPLAGWLGASAGLPLTSALLAAIAAAATLAAWRLWPTPDESILTHTHPDLTPDHPHLRDAKDGDGHSHAYVIDDLHHSWPERG